jgi:hypothetical protein
MPCSITFNRILLKILDICASLRTIQSSKKFEPYIDLIIIFINNLFILKFLRQKERISLIQIRRKLKKKLAKKKEMLSNLHLKVANSQQELDKVN